MTTRDDSPATLAAVDALRDEIRRHWATKADLAQMETRLLLRLAGIIVAVGAAVILLDRLLG